MARSARSSPPVDHRAVSGHALLRHSLSTARCPPSASPSHSSSAPAILVARSLLASTAAAQPQHRCRCCPLFHPPHVVSLSASASLPCVRAWMQYNTQPLVAALLLLLSHRVHKLPGSHRQIQAFIAQRCIPGITSNTPQSAEDTDTGAPSRVAWSARATVHYSASV